MLLYVNFSGTDNWASVTDIGDSVTDIHFGGVTVSQICHRYFGVSVTPKKADG